MNRSLGFLPLAASLFLGAHAAVPPAPKLLPKDTLLMVTVPDWTKASSEMSSGPAGQLWADPSMKAFRDKFEKGFKEEVLGQLEKELGIKAAEYAPLMRGQVSIAVIQNTWKPDSDALPGYLLVIDAKDKSDLLKQKLEEVRRKLADSKKPVKTEKVRDTEFASVSIDLPEGPADDEEEEEDADAKDKPKVKAESKRKMNLLFGQVDTALLVADSTATLEKVLAGMGGGAVSSLAEEPAFQASENAWFKKSSGYAWFHFASVYKLVSEKISAELDNPDAGVDGKAALKAVGFGGLKTISVAWDQDAGGSGAVLSLSIPEAQRVGLFKMLAMSTKESGPAPFIPADAVKFLRWRLDGQKLWSTLEETLAAVSPQMNGFFQMMVAQAGKDKDPSFDLKKNVVGNLGDDIISYSKAPKGKTLEELMAPPTLMLIGSPNGDGLGAAVKAAMGTLGAMGGGGGGEEAKDREFNGKKIRAIRTAGKGGRTELAASSGYLAVSSTPAVLEEFLRASESPGRSLKDDRAIAEASQKVGGMNAGLFGYENQRETMRSQWEFLRGEGMANLMGDGDAEGFKKAVDFKALPDYDKVAKYFGIAVYSGTTDAQGTHFRFYNPNPK